MDTTKRRRELKTVHKKAITIGEPFTLPACSNVVAFAEDGASDLCVWFERHTEIIDHGGSQFVIHGTGHEVGPEAVHIGTTVCRSGLVWHLYKYPPPEFYRTHGGVGQ